LLFVVVGEVQEYKKNTVKNIAKITYIHLRFIPLTPFRYLLGICSAIRPK